MYLHGLQKTLIWSITQKKTLVTNSGNILVYTILQYLCIMFAYIISYIVNL